MKHLCRLAPLAPASCVAFHNTGKQRACPQSSPAFASSCSDRRRFFERAQESPKGVPSCFAKRAVLECEDTDLRVEDGVILGSSVIAKPRGGWMYSRYIYGKVTHTNPIRISNPSGLVHEAKDLDWVALAEDNGWQEPVNLHWQSPGRVLIMQLCNQEWVTAKVARDHELQPIDSEDVTLKLEGITGLPTVRIDTVAYLFAVHEDCEKEFQKAEPRRGGCLHEHLAAAFLPDTAETMEEAQRRQSERWAAEGKKCKCQYPLRCVWVHPQVKEGSLNEFARRAATKKQECLQDLGSEIVLLAGPPAAGKSSAARLKPEELTGPLASLRSTAATLGNREEVNGDNIMDCMPGFASEYRRALASTDSNAWALTFFIYTLYHNPVRDSVRSDVMKVTVIDPEDLAVYYSSSMKGGAVDQVIQIMNWAQSSTSPVPHKRVPIRGFWPYTSQDARYTRQLLRAEVEAKEGKLQGGNLTQNLIALHSSAQQAELGIFKVLRKLGKGLTECNGSDGFGGDHFIVIDNEGADPKVLMDFVPSASSADVHIKEQLLTTAEELIRHRRLLDGRWDDMDRVLFQVLHFFLRFASEQESALLAQANAVVREMQVPTAINSLQDVLTYIVDLDEEIFFRKYKDALATSTRKTRSAAQNLTASAKTSLEAMSDEDVDKLQKCISTLRKYTCCAILRSLKA